MINLVILIDKRSIMSFSIVMMSIMISRQCLALLKALERYENEFQYYIEKAMRCLIALDTREDPENPGDIHLDEMENTA